MTKLSVNLNKIALLRNARGRDFPNVVEFAKKFIALGALVIVEKGAGETASISDAAYEEAGASIAVIEHLLAACAGSGIDNLYVEVNGPEIPIMDGSSSVFCDLFLQAGLMPQTAPRQYIRILEPVTIEDGPRRAALLPDTGDHLVLSAAMRISSPPHVKNSNSLFTRIMVP